MNNKRSSIRRSFTPRQSGIIIFLIGLAVIVGTYYIYTVYQNDPVDQKEEITVYTGNKIDVPVNQINTKTYENTDYGFKIEYPEDWQAEIFQTGEGINEIFSLNLSSSGNNVDISVMDDSFEGIVRNSISVTKESKVEINGLAAVRLDGSSAKDGSSISMVIIKNQGRLFSFSGIGQDLNDIVDTFKVL